MALKEMPVPFSELAGIADRLLEEADEDAPALAEALDRLDSGIRDELLVSDLLNAYQVFFYFFRQNPGDLEQDRMILSPASSLVHGIQISEIDLLEVIFRIENGEGVITVHEGDQVLANFRGRDAYLNAIRFIDETL